MTSPRRPHDRFAESWDLPVPLSHPGLPAFPFDALPGKLHRFAEALAISTETAPDLAGVLALAAIAASVAGKAEVVVKNDYREPLNLMCLVALPPGERKSGVFRRVFTPLEREESRRREAARPELARVIERQESLRKEIADLERRSIKRTDGSGDRIREAKKELNEIRPRPLPRLLADDATPESIPLLLADNGGRLCIASAEGGIVSTLRGRYSPGMVNIDVFLKGHAGDTLRVDRRNAEAIIVERPALTVALAVQPSVVVELVGEREFRGRGLVARFLFSIPSPRVGTRTFDAPSLPETIGREYDESIARLLALPSEDEPRALRLSRDAHDTWRRFAVEVDRKCAVDGELGALSDWGSKLPGATIRIAGLLHATELLDDASSVPISAETLLRSIDLGRYFISHARAVCGAGLRDERIVLAEVLLEWAARRDSFNVRDVQRAMKSRFPSANDARQAVALLVEHGYVRPRPACAPVRGRPPDDLFDVHPALRADEKPTRAESCEKP